MTANQADNRSWTINCFSQANPAGEGQQDIPALLRRVATTVEQFHGIEVQDISFQMEITENGPWPSLTVYFQKLEEAK